MTGQYLYPVYETDSWHSLSNRDCKGIYTSKEEAIEAIVEHHHIPLDEFDGRYGRRGKRTNKTRITNPLSDTGLYYKL